MLDPSLERRRAGKGTRNDMQGIDFIQDLAVVMLVAGLVGWVCHRLGLSVIVGFLAAGMVIGPFTPPFSLVTDVVRIETLAQVGLVFLMFAIGMKLSLRKLRRLGLPLVVATFVTALVVYNLSRLAAPWFGLSGLAAVFFAAMLIVSSSAIIGKVLLEAVLNHDKAGQMAMGVTVLEDVVAVISLALLSSVVMIGGGSPTMSATLGSLSAFVVLAVVVGLLAVPWLLRRLAKTASEELQTLVVAGLMLGLAWLAQRAGYSLAMGAFILGSIIAETPFRAQVDRVFEGARDMFSAVFFVSIGMQIDVRLLGEMWLLVLGVSTLALAARIVGGTCGMLVTGVGVREALRVGLIVTPIGEFSFIIVQLGIAAGVLPEKFRALAVGLSLVTALAASVLTKRAVRISDWVAGKQPRWIESWLDYYGGLLEWLRVRQQQSLFWRMSRKRLIQISLEVLLVTGLLLFAEPIFELVKAQIPGDAWFRGAPTVIFWIGLTLIVVLPLQAIWRNASALALIYSELSTAGNPRFKTMRPYIAGAFRTIAAALLSIWLGAIVPLGGMGEWMPVIVLAIALAALGLLRSKLIYWHSVLETELQERLLRGDGRMEGTTPPILVGHGEWDLSLAGCQVPDRADVSGRTLEAIGLRAKTGCMVARVERQGMVIEAPPGEFALYPRDRVLLLGTTGQIAAGKTLLSKATDTVESDRLDDVIIQTVEMPPASGLIGRTLAELAPTSRVGVQIVGIKRAGMHLLNPNPAERFFAGDEVLLLGTTNQIQAFERWLLEPPP